MKRMALVLLLVTFFSIPSVMGLGISEVGGFNFGVAYEIVCRDNIVYVSGNEGVDVFDISDRENPIKLTRIANDAGAFGLALVDDILYIAGISDGFFIVDVGDPINPVALGSISMQATDVYTADGYAYITSGTTCSIIDVHDPENPELLVTVPGLGRGDHLIVKDDVLYLGETNVGLKVYDISDRANPNRLRTVSGTTGIFDIQIDGSTLYLACHGNGIKVLDITDTTNPRVIGSFSNGGEAYGIDIVDNYLFVADLQQGIKIIDIQNPESPSLIASLGGTHPHDIAGDNQYIYLADQDHGLEVFVYGEDIANGSQSSNRVPLPLLGILLGTTVAIIALRRQKVTNRCL